MFVFVYSVKKDFWYPSSSDFFFPAWILAFIKVYEVVLPVSAIRLVGLFSYVNKPTTRVSATRTSCGKETSASGAARQNELSGNPNSGVMGGGGGGRTPYNSPYNCLYGKASPERSIFFRLQVNKG